MGTRVEKHKNKKKHKSRKKLKFMSILILVTALILALNVLDNILRSMTNTTDKSIYSLQVQDDVYNIQLLGKEYYVDKTNVENILYNVKNTYYSILKYKDKIINK